MVGLFKSLFARFYGIFGFVLLIIGLSGVPGDIDQWYNWISAVVENPTVQRWAEITAEAAQVINEPIFRVLLGTIGIIAIAWPLERFFGLRYKLKIWGKSIVSEKVWISQVEALREIRQSDWGELREPYVSETRSIIDSAAMLGAFHQKHTVSGMSPKRKAQRKFELFLEATLRAFHRDNPDAVRDGEGDVLETEMNALKSFLQEALDQEIFDEMGRVPSINVT